MWWKAVKLGARVDRVDLASALRAPRTRYVPTSCVGRGGMAEVWQGEAITERGDRYPVAIKRVLPELSEHPVFCSMFEDEARIGMLLNHPNIVRVVDSRRTGEALILIMELVDGPSLHAILRAAQPHARGMPVALALYVVQQIARALDYIHHACDARGRCLSIVHKDVSPQNVLLSRRGDVKLLDFGLSQADSHRTAHVDGYVGGKYGYLAPEVLLGKPVGPSVDVFAAGVILWEALAGRRLFRVADDQQTARNVLECKVPPLCQVTGHMSDQVSERTEGSAFARAPHTPRAPHIPRWVDHLLARLLARDPLDRVASAHDLVAELDYCLRRYCDPVGAADVALLATMHMAKQQPCRYAPAEVIAKLQSDLESFRRPAQDLAARPDAVRHHATVRVNDSVDGAASVRESGVHVRAEFNPAIGSPSASESRGDTLETEVEARYRVVG
jgi:serine/threonine protein kinase